MIGLPCDTLDRWISSPGSRALYRAEADPENAADVLVDNENPVAPQVIR
jgi:hypothetical protein